MADSEADDTYRPIILETGDLMTAETQTRVLRAIEVEGINTGEVLTNSQKSLVKYHVYLALLAYYEMLRDADAIIMYRELWERRWE
jgi:hypothetical protein